MRGQSPVMAVMVVPGLGRGEARFAAMRACKIARSVMPRTTGAAAGELQAIWGEDSDGSTIFGIRWLSPHIWYLESGIRPFTMRSLAGKTIPMWVNDHDGSLRRKNPRAETRRTEDGRDQVLIFRRAARMGERKVEHRRVAGMVVPVSVPKSYPGAPGRIAVNRSQGIMRSGDLDSYSPNPGQIARGNVGVRWRHPGINPRRFLARGVTLAAVQRGIPVASVQYRGIDNTPQHFTTVVYEGA